MGAIWARRQKLAGGSSAKRRRTSELVEDAGVTQKQQRAADDASRVNAAISDVASESTRPGIEQAIDAPELGRDSLNGSTDIDQYTRIGRDGDQAVQRAGHTAPSAEQRVPTKSPKDNLQGANFLERHVNANENRAGADFIRVSTAVDFQRDICKQYKLKGTCSYGDSCKFLHEREDHAAGRKIERNWNVAALKRSPRQAPAEDTKGCSICKTSTPKAAVRPACGHICCEACFISESKRPAAQCSVCHKRLGHAAESAT